MHLSVATFQKDLREEIKQCMGIELEEAGTSTIYLALGNLVRKYTTENWISTNRRYKKTQEKQVYYFSMEFLLGRLLESNLMNLGILEVCREGLKGLGADLDEISALEKDPGLGNGGLGRLAACFLDSMASLDIAGHGCGIRYKYGFFQQRIVEGYQMELPDDWLKTGLVWEVKKPDKAVEVRFGGRVEEEWTQKGLKTRHEGYDTVLAVPYDIPVAGYNNDTVNTLRLWSAEPMQGEFDFELFNRGHHMEAMGPKNGAEVISQVLYPDDQFEQGRLLRLKQQYFLVAAGLQSIIRTFKKKCIDIGYLDEYITIQINDTHPTLVIPELMRILMDEEGLSWDDAWGITTRTIAYTNHTIMPEALEKWPVDLFKKLLPRIFRIIEEINERFCRELWNRYEGDWDRISRMAIVADGYIKMAHLAVVGSKSVNGVAKIHTEILKKQVMSDFYYYFPYKFNNKTNGITHRRWLMMANPKLSNLITEGIGLGWTRNPEDLIQLKKYARDGSFLKELDRIKTENKQRLIKDVLESQGIAMNPDSIFDVHVKRIHAYKRQVLNIMNIINLYNRLKNGENSICPRTFIFGGKAAPGYRLAKQTIKLINSVAEIINNDPVSKDVLKVVFIEDYRVSKAQIIIPAADVSQQISTTTKEASGTGNMKFMMNGAITIGTMDGANVEMAEAMGKENMVIFGLSEDQVMNYYIKGGYNSMEMYERDDRIGKIITQMQDGTFSSYTDEFDSIIHSLLGENDQYFVLKDFDSYVEAQERMDKLFKDKTLQLEKSLMNIAASGIFSSDRAIDEYATGIWDVQSNFYGNLSKSPSFRNIYREIGDKDRICDNGQELGDSQLP